MPAFLDLHSQKNILREWCSYLQNDALGENQISELQKNFQDVKKLMSYYRCAILEVETKFNVTLRKD